VDVKDVSVVKDAVWLENLHITLPEYKDMFHYELTYYFMSKTLPIKWDNYSVSMCWKLITQWCNVIPQKNEILSLPPLHQLRDVL